MRNLILSVWMGAACLFGGSASVWAQGIGGELFFPGEHFDELVYQPRQSMDDPAYESILMDLREANFEPLAVFPADDPIRRMAKPVGLLKVLHTANKYSVCTASAIDRDLILTNWHCLPKYAGQVSRAVLQMGFYRSDDAGGVRVYSVDIEAVETDQALDYAVLRVNGDLSEWGTVKLAPTDPSANASLRVVHHPGGQPKQITQRSCRASAPPISQNRLMHKCDTIGGSSGAPVFVGYGAGAQMVALHYAGVPRSRLGIDPSLESNRAVPVSQLVARSAILQRLADTAGAPTPVAVADAPALLSAPEAAEPVRKAGEEFRDCTHCPEMVVIPAGSFTMGSPESEWGRPRRRLDDEEQHAVEIGYSFAVGKYEVTWDEWETCVSDGGCEGAAVEEAGGDYSWGKGRRPVIRVSWHDAQAYARWLSRTTGYTYRLLTEAEWEYAARAGTTTPFSFGATISSSQANYDGRDRFDGGEKSQYRGETIPVGSLPPNSFGLHDMHGNVMEWVEDCYEKSYSGAPKDGSARSSGSCEKRVLRGGSFRDEPYLLRSAARMTFVPTGREWRVGFRIARALPQ